MNVVERCKQCQNCDGAQWEDVCLQQLWFVKACEDKGVGEWSFAFRKLPTAGSTELNSIIILKEFDFRGKQILTCILSDWKQANLLWKLSD